MDSAVEMVFGYGMGRARGECRYEISEREATMLLLLCVVQGTERK